MKYLMSFLFAAGFIQIMAGIYLWGDFSWRFVFGGMVTLTVFIFVVTEVKL